MTTTVTREQWMLAQLLAGAVNACNAPFCVGKGEQKEEVNRDRNYVANVAAELARLCSPMAIEDAVQVLEEALQKSRENPL
jgi:hypothetical protein